MIIGKSFSEFVGLEARLPGRVRGEQVETALSSYFRKPRGKERWKLQDIQARG